MISSRLAEVVSDFRAFDAIEDAPARRDRHRGSRSGVEPQAASTANTIQLAAAIRASS